MYIITYIHIYTYVRTCSIDMYTLRSEIIYTYMCIYIVYSVRRCLKISYLKIRWFLLMFPMIEATSCVFRHTQMPRNYNIAANSCKTWTGIDIDTVYI